jgi:hypothetical protein
MVVKFDRNSRYTGKVWIDGQPRYLFLGGVDQQLVEAWWSKRCKENELVNLLDSASEVERQTILALAYFGLAGRTASRFDIEVTQLPQTSWRLFVREMSKSEMDRLIGAIQATPMGGHPCLSNNYVNLES